MDNNKGVETGEGDGKGGGGGEGWGEKAENCAWTTIKKHLSTQAYEGIYISWNTKGSLDTFANLWPSTITYMYIYTHI